MGSQVSAKTNDKEQQLKKASKMAMVRALLPIVGLVVIFLLFNVLTDFRMMGNMSLVLSQVYVTMIAAMGVFFIITEKHSTRNYRWHCIWCGNWSSEWLLLCIP